MTKHVVVVKHEGNAKPYNFNTDISTLKRGNLVVVETVLGFQLATVVRYATHGTATKWVVQKVDLTGYRQRELERFKASKLAAAKKRMAERQHQLIESGTLYRILAKEDALMATLLKEHDEIKGGN
ncbi:hypothetical protein [Peribacillus muralis]|uniref:hypothetical protein n=1 Tax=Peribacillus muralis TaxID=264697 RepID=UPI00366F1F08